MIALWGAKAAAVIESEIDARLARIAAGGGTVRIALFRAAVRDDCLQYEQQILTRCYALGVAVEAQFFVTEAALKDALCRAAADAAVDGILLLRPLPKSWDAAALTACIPPSKDLDGARGLDSAFVPCTAESCLRLLAAYGYSVAGQRCVVIGRSETVGAPLAALLQSVGADVTVCHSQTDTIRTVTRQAKYLFAACGVPKLIDASYVSAGQVVLDVGFHRVQDGFCGDVDAASVAPIVGALSPVPRGVGTVTLPTLLLHSVLAYERKHL